MTEAVLVVREELKPARHVTHATLISGYWSCPSCMIGFPGPKCPNEGVLERVELGRD